MICSLTHQTEPDQAQLLTAVHLKHSERQIKELHTWRAVVAMTLILPLIKSKNACMVESVIASCVAIRELQTQVHHLFMTHSASLPRYQDIFNADRARSRTFINTSSTRYDIFRDPNSYVIFLLRAVCLLQLAADIICIQPGLLESAQFHEGMRHSCVPPGGN